MTALVKRPSPTRNRILAALRELHPMTTRELASHLDMNVGAVEASIRVTRQNVGGLYIIRYERNYVTKGKPSPVFAIGDAPDARRPRNDRKADQQRYATKMREVIRRKNQRRHGTVQHPWLQILQGNLHQWSSQ